VKIMQTTSLPTNDVSLELPAPAASLRADTIAACVLPGVVKVPSWFTVGAALRVAVCKGVGHLLVVDRGSVVGTIAVSVLRTAPAQQPLARWMTPSTATLSPETPRAEAAWLMTSLGVDCLPVASGFLLVGLVSRDDLAVDEQRSAG
jgi:CBS domain-containing protein